MEVTQNISQHVQTDQHICNSSSQQKRISLDSAKRVVNTIHIHTRNRFGAAGEKPFTVVTHLPPRRRT